jgi:hypothetical protein
MIVLGGGIAAGDLSRAAIRQTVYRRSLPLATRRLQIVPSGLGPMPGVVGASAIAADELFSQEQLAGTLARHAASGSTPEESRGQPKVSAQHVPGTWRDHAQVQVEERA